MAENSEVTFGVDCHTPEGRVSLREDMAFLRALRIGARKGGEKIFWWLVGIGGTSAIAWFCPEINKHLK
jgi:hypothetical protein